MPVSLTASSWATLSQAPPLLSLLSFPPGLREKKKERLISRTRAVAGMKRLFEKCLYYITERTFSNPFIAKKRAKTPLIIHLPMAGGKEERRSRVSISY